jgi:hypothetical protein
VVLLLAYPIIISAAAHSSPTFSFLRFVCLCSILPTFQPLVQLIMDSGFVVFRDLDFELLVLGRKLLEAGDWYQDSVGCLPIILVSFLVSQWFVTV